MINFHKYSFLDCKRLKGYLENKNAYLEDYNPVWLFIYSDYYKPEISFGNEFIFIRYNIDRVGKVYYPPIKVQGGYLNMTLLEMEESLPNENDVLNLGPILDSDINMYKEFSIKSYENRDLDTYIYSLDKLRKLSTHSKKYKASAKKFIKEHKNLFLKRAKKEDFTAILEFISRIRENEDELDFYPKLNALKQAMDHLYEFDLVGAILQDEENIYGFIIGDVLDNCFYYHLLFYDKTIEGVLPVLISESAKHAHTMARFASFGKDNGNKIRRELYESLEPIRLEKYNANFLLSGSENYEKRKK